MAGSNLSKDLRADYATSQDPGVMTVPYFVSFTQF